MKIIITEDQMDKFTSKSRQLIEKHGFVMVSDMMGINKLKLAKMSGLPIKGEIRDSRFTDDSEIVISDLLRDLLKKDNKYKTCELDYYGDGMLLWECRFKDEENYYFVGVDVTPYWEGDNQTQVSITNVHITPIDSPKDKKEYEVHRYDDMFDCPESFNNVDELINWFKNEYIPTAYNKIVKMFEDFKLRRL